MENLQQICLKRLQKVNESIKSLKADPFSGVCHGLHYPSPNPLTDEQKQAIIQKLPAAREVMQKEFNIIRNDDLGLFAGGGSRFNDDDAVIDRIESVSKERLVGKDPTSEDVIYDALYDIASADYYYTFEKDWGSED